MGLPPTELYETFFSKTKFSKIGTQNQKSKGAMILVHVQWESI